MLQISEPIVTPHTGNQEFFHVKDFGSESKLSIGVDLFQYMALLYMSIWSNFWYRMDLWHDLFCASLWWLMLASFTVLIKWPCQFHIFPAWLLTLWISISVNTFWLLSSLLVLYNIMMSCKEISNCWVIFWHKSNVSVCLLICRSPECFDNDGLLTLFMMSCVLCVQLVSTC